MRLSRAEAKANHTLDTQHAQFSETVYGVLCATCHNYILIDRTNCPSNCREHDACRQAYGGES